MLENVRTKAGRPVTRTFLVNVRRPQIRGGGEVRLKPQLARCVVEGIRRAHLPLARLLEDSPAFDPAHPDPFELHGPGRAAGRRAQALWTIEA